MGLSNKIERKYECKSWNKKKISIDKKFVFRNVWRVCVCERERERDRERESSVLFARLKEYDDDDDGYIIQKGTKSHI